MADRESATLAASVDRFSVGIIIFSENNYEFVDILNAERCLTVSVGILSAPSPVGLAGLVQRK